MLELKLLGVLEVMLDGQPITFARRGSVGLLAYLVLSGRAHGRESLATLLAGDSTEDYARKHLSNVLIDLRQQLGEYILATRQTVMFASDGPYRLDVTQFEHHVTQALQAESPDDMEQALRLYRDEFLSGLVLPGAPDFDDWLSAEREELRCRYLMLLRALVDSSMRRGCWSEGVSAARRLTREEPWQEDAHCQLMLMLARSGQRHAAIEQYAVCRRALREELAIEPQPETTALFNRLRAALTRPPHNLPVPVSPLIGRSDELRLMITLLSNADSRLATISGLGGSGKSRLAIEVGRAFAMPDQQLAEQPFPDGIAFVAMAELAPAPAVFEQNPQAAANAIFEAIDIALELPRSPNTTPRARVLEYLRSKQMLLILDNLEHLLAGCAAVSDLLARTPHVKLLVTSRVPLHVPGERVLPMDGLQLPADESDLESAAASALFLTEARRVELGYVLPATERLALVELCRMLGGLPLALILAARWSPVLTCSQMLTELGHGLDVLATSEPDLPERQRSLAVVLDSTLARLHSTDRALAQSLAVQQQQHEQTGLRNAGVARDQMARVRNLREQALVSFDSTRGTLRLHPLVTRYVAAELCFRSTPAYATRSA
jgi:DNA-binding SARP family transcriptional activator/predicted ATPase